jgi:hypothetical protein
MKTDPQGGGAVVAQFDAEDERSWLRFGCPVCGGWLGVPGDVKRGQRAERVARRIDAFVQRHGHVEQGGAT